MVFYCIEKIKFVLFLLKSLYYTKAACRCLLLGPPFVAIYASWLSVLSDW
jgi:hypothetical protein